MAKGAPPKIRLGGPGMPGAEVYNYYQLISLLSGLYVKALDRRDEETFSGAWNTCSISILEQVGMAHECWGQIQAQAAASVLQPENITLIKRTLTVVKRLSLIDDQLNEWVLLSRWARVLMHVEKQLKTLGQKIVLQNPFLKNSIDAMQTSFDARSALLNEVKTVAEKDERSLNQNYAEPVAL